MEWAKHEDYHQSSLAGELMDSADAREDLTKFLLY